METPKKKKKIIQTFQDIENQTKNNIIQKTRVYNWSLKSLTRNLALDIPSGVTIVMWSHHLFFIQKN